LAEDVGLHDRDLSSEDFQCFAENIAFVGMPRCMDMNDVWLDFPKRIRNGCGCGLNDSNGNVVLLQFRLSRPFLQRQHSHFVTPLSKSTRPTAGGFLCAAKTQPVEEYQDVHRDSFMVRPQPAMPMPFVYRIVTTTPRQALHAKS